MGYLRRTIMLGAVLAVAPVAAAGAADFDPYKGSYKDAPHPAPSIKDVPPPAPVPHKKDFYLRGYIGMTNQHVGTFTNEEIRTGDFTIHQKGFDSAPLFGIGIGYVHSPWLRSDVTGEYRGKSKFRGLDTYVDPFCGPGECVNAHTGYKSEWLFLKNLYLDLGEWKGVTPYVGAGIGAASVKLHDFWDVNLVENGFHWADSNSQWNFAWALHAGLAYDVTDSMTIDLAYRYVDMGNGKTGNYSTFGPGTGQESPTTLKDITSHDLMLGVRWNFDYGYGGMQKGHHSGFKF